MEQNLENQLKQTYHKSIPMWNTVYSKCKLSNLANRQLSVEPTFDVCLDLFASACPIVLDYGCGTGDILFQTYQFGTMWKGTGIDLSQTGIDYANQEAKISHYSNLQFITGSVETLAAFSKESVDGIILSNVLDVIPRPDAIAIFTELTRILKKEGLMFVKLNPYFEQEKLQELGLTHITDNLYAEDGILRLREIDTLAWFRAFEKEYEIRRYLEFPYPWQEGLNRLFLLRKK